LFVLFAFNPDNTCSPQLLKTPISELCPDSATNYFSVLRNNLPVHLNIEKSGRLWPAKIIDALNLSSAGKMLVYLRRSFNGLFRKIFKF